MSKKPKSSSIPERGPSSLIEDEVANARRLVRLANLALHAVDDGGVTPLQDDHLAGARTCLEQVIGLLDQIEAASAQVVDDEPAVAGSKGQ